MNVSKCNVLFSVKNKRSISISLCTFTVCVQSLFQMTTTVNEMFIITSLSANGGS